MVANVSLQDVRISVPTVDDATLEELRARTGSTATDLCPAEDTRSRFLLHTPPSSGAMDDTYSLQSSPSRIPQKRFKSKKACDDIPTPHNRNSTMLNISRMLDQFAREVQGDTLILDSEETVRSVGSMTSRDSRAGLMPESESSDSEDFTSAERRYSHYRKTTEYEQSRLAELKVTIEHTLQTRFKDLLVVKSVFQFLGPLSRADFDWVGIQAESDYFLNELRWSQYKTFLRYIILYDIPPLEVDRDQWDKEFTAYICTVILFTLLFVLVIPGVLITGCQACLNFLRNELVHHWHSLSLIIKMSIILFFPLVLAILLLSAILFIICVLLVRLVNVPCDIAMGWLYMCKEEHWICWLDSIHARAQCMRCLYDKITPQHLTVHQWNREEMSNPYD